MIKDALKYKFEEKFLDDNGEFDDKLWRNAWGRIRENVNSNTRGFHLNKRTDQKKITITKLLKRLEIESSDQYKVRNGVTKSRELLNINEE